MQEEPATSPFSRCLARAVARHGLLSRQEALDEGVSSDAIYRACKSGKLEKPLTNVYRGVAEDVEAATLAACLSIGDAIAYSRSAAALWKLDGCEPGPIDVLVTRRISHRRLGITVYRSEPLLPADTTEIDHIPVTW